MKTKIFMLLMAVCMTMGMNAQTDKMKHTPQEMARMQTVKLMDKVKLTEDQRIKVYDVYLKYATDMNERRQNRDMEPTREEMKQYWDNNKNQLNSDIKGVLNADQGRQYDDYMRDMMDKMDKMDRNNRTDRMDTDRNRMDTDRNQY